MLVQTLIVGYLQNIEIIFQKNVPAIASLYLSVYFQTFQAKEVFLQTLNLKHNPSRVRRWDSNSEPLDHKSSCILGGIQTHNL